MNSSKIPRMRNYHIKAYTSQVKSWKRCARKLGYNSVSRWVRDTLNSVVMGSVRPKFGETEMKRGVKTRDDEIAESFQFRVTPWERDEWSQCADQEGLNIGEWCRQSLDHGVKIGSEICYKKVI